MLEKIGLLGRMQQGAALLEGVVPRATLEGLTRGELFIPYAALLAQLEERCDATIEVLELSGAPAGALTVAVRHREYGEGTFCATPGAFEITLDEAAMDWRVEVVELKGNGVRNQLIAKIVEWFPQRVLLHLLDEATVGEGIRTTVDDDGRVRVELTEYLQNLPLAKRRLPIINQSPLAWVRLSALQAEADGLRVKCGLRQRGL